MSGCCNSNSDSCSSDGNQPLRPANPKRDVNNDLSQYWDTVYNTLDFSLLGWYEEIPQPSLDLISKTELDLNARILNIGAGATTLVDHLLEKGHSEIICTDISEVALDVLKNRIGEKSSQVTWSIDDMTHPNALAEIGQVDIWHDRAVVHFFTKEEDQSTYFNKLNEKVKPGGYAILATFNLQGASKCSGLPVHRYNQRMLSNKIGKDFELIESFNYTYTMPSGDTREYVYTLFRKNK